MKLRGNSYFLIVIMVIVLVMIVLSLRMEFLTSKLLPLLIGSIVFILAAIGLVQEIVTRDETKAITNESETGEGEKVRIRLREYLPIGSWVIGVTLAVYLVGFIITIPLFVFAYMKSHGVRWLLSITAAVLTTVFVYTLFELALRVELYRGLLFTSLIQ